MGWRSWVALLILLTCHYLLAVSAVNTKSPTYDEPFHLLGGYSYWKLGDYRINAENGILPQRLSAIPLMWMDVKLGMSTDDPRWVHGDPSAIAPAFISSPDNATIEVIRAGRMTMAVTGVLVVALVFFWSRALWGVWGGWLSALTAAVCPTMLAHGPLCTSDMTSTLMFSAALLLAWRAMHHATVWSVCAASVPLVGAFVAKMAGPLVVVMLVLMVAVHVAAGRPMAVRVPGATCWRLIRSRGRVLAVSIFMLTFWAVVVWVGIWAIYGFRFRAAPDATASYALWLPDAVLRALESAPVNLALWAKTQHFVPEAYAWGHGYLIWQTFLRTAFLNGQYSMDGFRAYFPYAFIVKTPISLLALLIAGVGAVGLLIRQGVSSRLPMGGRWRYVYWLVPGFVLIAVYLTPALFTKLNIGHRHLLPIYPVLYVLIGGVVCLTKSATSRTRVVPMVGAAVLLLGLFAESILAWPNYLAFFNPIGGGTRNGYRHLVDSNADWGQDLPALRAFIESRRHDSTDARPIYFAYFGTTAPGKYEVDAMELISHVGSPRMTSVEPLRAGVYCISASLLQGAYTPKPGPWSTLREEMFQTLSAEVNVYFRRTSSPGAQSEADAMVAKLGPREWEYHQRMYRDRRFERLCSFLRGREPDSVLNGSILVFNLDDAELANALTGPPREAAPSELFDDAYRRFLSEHPHMDQALHGKPH